MALFRVSNERAQFDAAGIEATDQYGAGIRFTQGGNARVTTASPTNYNHGIPMSSTGQVAIVDATAGLPAGTIYLNGLPISGDKVCVSRNATAVVSSGLPFDSAGAVAADVNFDLNFIGTNTLNSSVTFTRASTGTFFNSSGVLTSAGNNVPRFDYNPATLAAQGLLIEEQRTNSIRNNTMQGAVAGTPGTAPTNWSTSVGGSGITRTLVGTGTENGITYIDFQFSGTGSGSAFQVINTETPTGIAAATGQTWSGSFYLKLVAGSTTGTNITMQLLELASGSGVVQNLSAALSPTTQNLASQRNTYSATLSGGGTVTNLQQGLRLLFTNGVAVDITLRIGLPQLELGAFATSVIPTTTTALTRSADVASVNTLAPWFNSVAGTLFAEYNIPFDSSVSVFPIIAGFSDGTFNNCIVNYERTLDDARRGIVRTLGVTQFDTANGAAYTYGTNTKQALAYATNDVALSVAGTAPTTTTTATIPTVNVMGLGSNNFTGGSLAALNGYLRRIVYYPTRLSNAQLQALTA